MHSLLAMFTPTYVLPYLRYGNQFFVDYNIKCGKGQLAYVNITALKLQGKVCPDPNQNNQKL